MQLYVGNLSFSTTGDDLTALFSQFGDVVSAKIISDRETGRSRGFGFVEMGSKDAGIKAITDLSGKEVDGRKLIVNEAQKKSQSGGGGGGGNRGPRRDRY